MPSPVGGAFLVTCKGCGRSLATIARLRDPEIARIVDHLRACPWSEAVGHTPMLGEIVAHVAVTQPE